MYSILLLCNRLDCNSLMYRPSHSVTIGTDIQFSVIQYNTVEYSILQYNTVQYSTIQYNAVKYNTIQFSTVQYLWSHFCTVLTCCHVFVIAQFQQTYLCYN